MNRWVGLFLVPFGCTGLVGCNSLIGLIDVPDPVDGGDGGVVPDASLNAGAGFEGGAHGSLDATQDTSVRPGLDATSYDGSGSDGNTCVADGAACSALPNGTAIVWPTGTPAGLCSYGHFACGVDGGVQCVGAVGPIARACSSALDNDCDGQPDNTVDSTCQCASGMTYSCTGPAPNNCTGTRTCDTTNPASYQLAACNVPVSCQCKAGSDMRTCGSTACATTQTCQSDGTWPACTLPSNCACAGTQTAPCSTTMYGCPGTQTCSNYQYGACEATGICICMNGMTMECNAGACNESAVTCVGNSYPACPTPVTPSACTTQGTIEGTTQSCGGATTCPGVTCPAPVPSLCTVNGCPGYDCGGGCNAVQTPQTFTVGGSLPSTSTNGLAATFTGCTIAFADFPAPPPPSMPSGAYNITYAMAIRGTASCTPGTRFIEQFSCSSTVPGGGACTNHPGFCEAPCSTGVNSAQNFIFDATDFSNGATGSVTCPESDSVILTHLQQDSTSCTYTATVTSVTWTYTVCQ